MSRLISIYTRKVKEAQEFWHSIEQIIPENWSFVVKSYSEAVNANSVDQCIIYDATLKEVRGLTHFQRSFRMPFVYVGDKLNSSELLEVLKLGAKDVLCSLDNKEEIIAKMIYRFSSIQQREDYHRHEALIEKAELTKVEEKIFRLILNREVVTTTQNIFDIVWKGKAVHIKTFNVHISKLRKKLRKIDLDIKYLSTDKTYHVTKRRSIEEHAFPLKEFLSESYCNQ
jgi:DNA-binding response OmpR family regulator